MNSGRIEESGPATKVSPQRQADFIRLLLAAVPRIDTVAAFWPRVALQTVPCVLLTANGRCKAA